MMKTLIFAVSLAVSAPFASAAIYKYVDESGRVTYSNVPIKGGKVVSSLPQLSTYSSSGRPAAQRAPRQRASTASYAPARATGGSKPATNVPVNASYPSVDTKTQAGRDGMRQRILQQELANERKALVDAQQALADARQSTKAPTDVKRRQDAVTDRQKNIEALQRELGQM